MSKYQVIFHVDEVNKLNLVLRNISNLLKDFKENELEVELVAYAEGVAVMQKKDNTYLDKVDELHKKGVIFGVCANTMQDKNIKKEDLLDFATVVSSGVGELVRKQKEGWIYLRP